MCGVVFHNIAEGIMAKQLKHNVSVARDSMSVLMPDVKTGNMLAADYVLSLLNVKTANGWNGSYATGNPVWGRVVKEKNSVTIEKQGTPSMAFIPNVEGMGARDAVYLLESRGVKVTVQGRGKVKKQSIAPDTKIKKGMRINLELS